MSVEQPDRTKIGRYDITRVLGRGGMGVVYLAEDRRMGRQVAIKTRTDGFIGQPEMLKRFYKEAQAVAQLQHPNIVIIHDMGDEDGLPYIVMEFISGAPLDKVIKDGMVLGEKPFSLIDKLTVIEHVCSALGYAHQREVVHRDIKPANVIVETDPMRGKIVDFGIARIQNTGDTQLTGTGQVFGTLHYIAPERLQGQRADGRSDIFSTGVMLYLLLTSELPFTGEDMTVMHKIVHEPYPPLSNYLSSYPPILDDIMKRALAKDPDQRYGTAEEFAADLHSLIEELRRGQVKELYDDAQRLASQQQFAQARDLLVQVVRVDPQHSGARQLLSSVRQNLVALQRAEQVRQLTAEAAELAAADRLQEALSALEQASKLDPNNQELKTRSEALKERKRRKEEIGALISQAASLRERGDWKGALEQAEKALGLDPENSELRAIHAEISRQAKLVAQQSQLRDLLGKARQEIGARRYTEAIEILQEASKLDASPPEIESLLATAMGGQEQERRRKILEQIQAEIENNLAAAEYDRALEQVERALESLPNESALLELKTRVALQARKFHVRQKVDATSAKAQEIFLESPSEALQLVQKALEELPGEERLLALEASLKNRLKSAKQEEVRSRYLREAQEALNKSEFAKAVEILESYQLEFADSAGVGELLEVARGELAQQQRRTQTVERAAQARKLIQEEQYEQAIRLLEPLVSETGDLSLSRILEEARALQQETARKAEALMARVNRLRERGQLDEAIELLQGVRQSSIPGTPQQSVLEEMRAEQSRKQAMADAMQAAAKAAGGGDYAAALEALRSAERAWGQSPEITRAIAECESRRGEVSRKTVGEALDKGRAALVANDAQAAIKELNAVRGILEFAPPALQSEWRRLSEEAVKTARKSGPAAKAAFPEIAAEPKRGKGMILAVAAVVLVLAIGAGIWFLRPKNRPVQPGNTANVPTQPQAPVAVPTGTLLVQGNVGGVQVFVDGALKDFTDSSGSLKLRLDPGTHTIRFAKPEYEDLTLAPVTIAADQAKEMPFTLKKSENANVPVETNGYISVHTTPGALVSINNAAIGNADARGDLIKPVKAGSGTLSISLDGYQTVTEPFSVKAGENASILASLTPVPQPPKSVASAPQPVQIAFFVASAAQIEQGQSTTLQWQTSNAKEVSIDNGIARVDSSGQTTVQPQSTTTYVLTATGNGGPQQKSITIVVQPKQVAVAQPPPVVQQPKPQQPADPTSQIRESLNNFNAAFNAADVARMLQAWPGMSGAQVNGFKTFFQQNPGSKVSDDCPASVLTISGDAATWSCTETMTLMTGGKSHPSRHRMLISFAKKNGSWVISNRQ